MKPEENVQDMQEMQNESVQDVQQEQVDYLKQQEEQINETKAKLSKLLEKLQKKPPKETISKKILRLRISRLRAALNRSMERYKIELEADLEENEKYDEFEKECENINERISELEDFKAELELGLSIYEKRQNYRGNRQERLSADIQSLKPKSRVNVSEKVEIKDEPKSKLSEKAKEIKHKLEEVENNIAELENELEEKKLAYREYRIGLDERVEKDINSRMQELEQEEIQRKREQKEQLAVTNPSIWTKMRNGFRKIAEKFSKWNENRKERSSAKDDMATEGVEELLNTPTKREEFIANLGKRETPENPVKPEEKIENENLNYDNRVYKAYMQIYEAKGKMSREDLIKFEDMLDSFKVPKKERDEGFKIVEAVNNQMDETDKVVNNQSQETDKTDTDEVQL